MDFDALHVLLSTRFIQALKNNNDHLTQVAFDLWKLLWLDKPKQMWCQVFIFALNAKNKKYLELAIAHGAKLNFYIFPLDRAYVEQKIKTVRQQSVG